MSQYPITWITDGLAVGYAPMSYAELDSIKARGVDAIVNLCAEFSDLHTIEESSGFEVCYLPIWDEETPDLEDMEKALAWLDEALYLGKKVLVHCRYGIGRTGTFVTSYMIRKGLTIKAASRKLKSSRAAPSNYGQWKLVKKYGKKSGRLKIREPSLEMNKRVDLSHFFSDYEDLIKSVDQEVQKQTAPGHVACGRGGHQCCFEYFDLQLIEVAYLHSKINRRLKSDQRERLIEKGAEASKINSGLCPLNSGSGCVLYEMRPARCRIYGMIESSSHKDEIREMLLELSRAVFLAFSGKFLPDEDFTFSMAETVSGKFVQKYFHYMSAMEKKVSLEH